jgi:uncharacterized circularly permuted ATP-grasp superfamily protein
VPGELFSDYDPESFFDEVFSAPGEVRDHYVGLLDRLKHFSADDLARRERRRDAAFRNQGITFTVYEDQDEGIERTFPMDLLPRVITGEEWTVIEAGLVQRVTALNRFLDDLYVGERAAIHDGIIPWWLVTSSDGFSREAFGIPVPLGARCLVAGIDLVRDADGTFCVLEDNLRSPSGISYVVENRVAMTRLLPNVFSDASVTKAPERPLAALPVKLANVVPSIVLISVAASGPAGAAGVVASACADVSSVSPSEPAEQAASIADTASRPANVFVLTINSPGASVLTLWPRPSFGNQWKV